MSNKNKESLNSLIKIGEIIKPHGVKGYLKFFLYNKDSDILFNRQFVYLESETDRFKLEVEDINFISSTPLIKFIDIDNREKASRYRQFKVSLPKDSFKQDNKELYLFDFVGCRLYFEDDYIGLVKNVVTFSGNDLLLVDSDDSREHYIPVNKELIKFFDIEDRKLVMNGIEGLLDIC